MGYKSESSRPKDVPLPNGKQLTEQFPAKKMPRTVKQQLQSNPERERRLARMAEMAEGKRGR